MLSPYMTQTSRNDASTIFQARAGMTKVKMNYTNKYKSNLKCRACQQEEESQKHIMEECRKIHTNEETMVKEEEIYTEDVTILKNTTKKIISILAKLDKAQATASNNC